MKIFGGHDGGSGCAWYRMYLPLAELGHQDDEQDHEGYDFEVTFADAGDDGHPPLITLADLGGYDVIVAQRWNKHDGLSVWRRARTPYSRLVFELDDDLWNITPENWNAYHLYNRPDIRDAVEHAAETADLVTVSTEPLGEVLRQFNPNVAVLPNAIPGWACTVPRSPGAQQRTRPRVGWQGGASHGIDVGQVAGPVRRFLHRFPGWDLQLNGADYRHTFGVSADRAFLVPWVPVYTSPDRYYASIDFDIGLAPLYPTDFARSKSAIKVIEYGARGIPSVASDIEPYRAVITHGVDGFLVRGPEKQRKREWFEYLCTLAGDDELRAKMGAAAQEMARRHLIEDRWRDWAAAYRGLFRR